jgi:biotin operon repressor
MTKKSKVVKLSKAQINKIFILRGKGFSQKAIGEKIGCSRSAIWYWLTK